MKSAKKLLLLVLSLVLLIGIFAVVALADDAATEVQSATVVYPDGTVDTYTAAGAFNPSITVTEDGLFYGKGNTLYKDAGQGWIYTDADGNTVTEITADMIATGAKITASGFEQVYYTHTTAGATQYNTSASSHATDLTKLLKTPAIGGSDIKLYADMKTGKLWLRSAHNTKNYLDLNGHELVVTATDYTIFTEAVHFAIYSSQPGAVLDASAGERLIYSDDDGKTYDTEYNTANPGNTVTVCQHGGMVILGERATANTSTTTEHGKNLTVLCQTISSKYLYGGGGNGAVLGGTYVQTGSAATFVEFIRFTPPIRNCNFVITNAETVPVTPNATKTFTNCNFVYTGEGSIGLTNATTAGTFTDCNFFNITPSYSAAHTYNGCAFGTSTIFTTEDLNPSASANAHLAHGTTVKEITVNGETYALDGVLITDPATQALKLTFPRIGTEYFAIGATLTYAADPSWEEERDGFKYSNPYYDYNALGTLIDADRKVLAAGEAEVPLRFASSPAFTYQVDGEEMQYIASLGSPEEDGKNFYNLLNDKSNVTIKMYTDIVLYNGVLFGTMEITYGEPYKDADGKDRIDATATYTSGNVDWDLNGHTVTIDETAKPLVMTSWSESQYTKPKHNVFHYLTGKHTFKLYSSVPGGEYINNNKTAHAIFGINKYTALVPSVILGTSDITQNGGNNLKMTSNVPFCFTYETGGDGPEGYTLGVNGGTYVYGGAVAPFITAQNAKFYNATILTTGAAKSVFISHYYRAGKIQASGCTIVANNSTTSLVEQGYLNGLQLTDKSYGKDHVHTFTDCTIVGVKMATTYTPGWGTINFAGETFVDNAENLAVAYPTAPDGKIVAYSSVTANGEAVKVLGYCDASAVVTVQNIATGVTEDWFPDVTYLPGEMPSIQKVGGVWYYYVNPAWVATVDGAVVEDVLAGNKGKTVVVSIGGEKDLLYYTVLSNGVINYYNGNIAVSQLQALLSPAASQTYEVRFYHDIEVSPGTAAYQIGKKDYEATILIDLNGYTWKVNSSASYSFICTSATSFIYSSVPGGVLDIAQTSGIACTDGGADAYFGEPTTSGTEYGQNLTVYCKSIHSGQWWSNNGYIVGGTYIQPEGVTATHFFGIDAGPTPVVRNSTFIVNSLSDGFVRGVKGTFTNCVFIAKEASNIVTSGSSNSGATFNGCYFYNVIPNVPEGTTVTYTNCYFGSCATSAYGTGFIAKTDKFETKTANGVDYIFDAVYTTSAELIEWGNGFADEYWQVGATATHAGGIIVDDFFGYTYAPFEVVADGDNTPAYDMEQVAAIAPGTITMSLTLQSKIGLNLFFTEGLAGATITVDGTAVTLGEVKDGYYAFTKALVPNLANSEITIEITLANESKHTVKISLATYAEAILKSEDAKHVAAHKLTYAMVEYVRAMTGDANFCKDAAKPVGYEPVSIPALTPATEAADGENTASGYEIAFQLNDAIAIAVTGGTTETVTLKIANRTFTKAMEGGTVVFNSLAVNELYNGFIITIDGIPYEYSLVEYYYAMQNSNDATKLAALYNYAHYAFAYVRDNL